MKKMAVFTLFVVLVSSVIVWAGITGGIAKMSYARGMHDCYLCDETGCHWAPCPIEQCTITTDSGRVIIVPCDWLLKDRQSEFAGSTKMR